MKPSEAPKNASGIHRKSSWHPSWLPLKTLIVFPFVPPFLESSFWCTLLTCQPDSSPSFYAWYINSCINITCKKHAWKEVLLLFSKKKVSGILQEFRWISPFLQSSKQSLSLKLSFVICPDIYSINYGCRWVTPKYSHSNQLLKNNKLFFSMNVERLPKG